MTTNTDKLGEARRLAEGLMAQYGLSGWVFAFDRARRRAGVCRFPTLTRPGRIGLSLYFVERNDLEQVRDTILHEIAHALAGPRAGHGPRWKAACSLIGAVPERCYRSGDVTMPGGKWRATCPGCGRQHHRHRRPPSLTGYHCKPCGRVNGQLVWRHL
jgi:predicted SprT family Zn-dependent metalloprotease